jgi:hypothetical protein
MVDPPSPSQLQALRGWVDRSTLAELEAVEMDADDDCEPAFSAESPQLPALQGYIDSSTCL